MSYTKFFIRTLLLAVSLLISAVCEADADNNGPSSPTPSSTDPKPSAQAAVALGMGVKMATGRMMAPAGKNQAQLYKESFNPDPLGQSDFSSNWTVVGTEQSISWDEELGAHVGAGPMNAGWGIQQKGGESTTALVKTYLIKNTYVRYSWTKPVLETSDLCSSAKKAFDESNAHPDKRTLPYEIFGDGYIETVQTGVSVSFLVTLEFAGVAEYLSEGFKLDACVGLEGELDVAAVAKIAFDQSIQDTAAKISVKGHGEGGDASEISNAITEMFKGHEGKHAANITIKEIAGLFENIENGINVFLAQWAVDARADANMGKDVVLSYSKARSYPRLTQPDVYKKKKEKKVVYFVNSQFKELNDLFNKDYYTINKARSLRKLCVSWDINGNQTNILPGETTIKELTGNEGTKYLKDLYIQIMGPPKGSAIDLSNVWTHEEAEDYINAVKAWRNQHGVGALGATMDDLATMTDNIILYGVLVYVGSKLHKRIKTTGNKSWAADTPRAEYAIFNRPVALWSETFLKAKTSGEGDDTFHPDYRNGSNPDITVGEVLAWTKNSAFAYGVPGYTEYWLRFGAPWDLRGTGKRQGTPKHYATRLYQPPGQEPTELDGWTTERGTIYGDLPHMKKSSGPLDQQIYNMTSDKLEDGSTHYNWVNNAWMLKWVPGTTSWDPTPGPGKFHLSRGIKLYKTKEGYKSFKLDKEEGNYVLEAKNANDKTVMIQGKHIDLTAKGEIVAYNNNNEYFFFHDSLDMPPIAGPGGKIEKWEEHNHFWVRLRDIIESDTGDIVEPGNSTTGVDGVERLDRPDASIPGVLPTPL